jgi:thioredoxin 1
MWRTRAAWFLALVIGASALLVAGCSSGTTASGEVSGKPVVIDFWSPGCPPCEAMEPLMAQLEEEYGDRVDFKAYNTSEEQGKANEFGIMYVPTFFFIDAEGNIVSKAVGQQSIETMRSKIEALLE